MKTIPKPEASVSRPLRVLIVDDSKPDAELLLRALMAGGFEVSYRLVDTPAAMRTAMEGQEWDVITSDHAMPQFSGPAALVLAQEICPHVPFIIVSGEIDLNLAVSLIKGGAQEYVQKEELVRLVPVIERILHDAETLRGQHEAEKALQLSEARYRRLFETAQDGILIVDAVTGQIEDANPFLMDLVGFSLEEYLGKKLWEIGVFKDSEASKSAFLELQSKGYIRHEHIPLHTRDGGSVEVEFVSNVYMVDNKRVIQCNIRDISERRQAEAEIRTLNAELKQRMQALEVSEVRYRRLFETAQDGILIVNADTGEIDDVNPFLLDLVGYSRENYLRKKVWEVAVFKDEDASKAAFLELQKTGYIRYEDIPVRTRAGGCVDVEFVSNVYLVDQKRVIQCNIRDITERKHAEEEVGALNADLERRVQARTAQVEALNKAAESFNYSVSHDLRAPLRRISSFAKILEEDCAGTLDAAGKRLIGNILASTQHMTALIEALLKLASLSSNELQRKPTSLSSLVHVVANELQQNDQGRHVEFVIAEGITAACDANLLRIVIENLLENAWKFTSHLAAARIEFGVTRQTNKPATYFVRDNGAGFNMKFADKLFGVFQRLHSESEFPGTGIGLASVQRIVHRHGGHIWAESTIGQGATFYFVLEAGPQDRPTSAAPLLAPLLFPSPAIQ
jgi:PAS domain S-box-containing protein